MFRDGEILYVPCPVPGVGIQVLSAHGCHVFEYFRSYRPFLAIHSPRTVLGPPDPEKTNLGGYYFIRPLTLVVATPSRVRADG